MRPAKRIGIVSLAAVIAALAIAGARTLARRAPSAPHAASTEHAASAPPLRFAWARGSRYVYAVRWTAESRAALGDDGRTVDGRARVAGELSLSMLGELDGRAILAARFERLDEHALSVMGGDLVPTDDDARATLEKRDAWIAVGADGTVGTLWFAKGSPATFTHVMNAVLSQMQATLAGDDRRAWTARETTTTGTATVRYAKGGDDATSIERTRERYEALFGAPRECEGCATSLIDRGHAAIDRAGFLRSIDDDERVTLARRDGAVVLASATTFRATWLRTEPFAAPTSVTIDPSTLDARRLGEIVAARDPEADLLAQRAGAMDRDAMELGLRAYDATGGLDRAFVGRASALVTLHPELCAELAAIAEDARTGARGRALAFDVLASAGTDASQAAMRRALGAPAVKRDPGAYALLLQRFAVIDRPAPESARFVDAAWSVAASRGDRGARDAAAYTLGAMTRAIARGDDRSAARAYDAKLRRALDDAKTPRDRVTYLTALGNAADPGDERAIGAYAGDADPDVRAAAANALRGATSSDARATLLALAGDPDAGVQAIAMGAIDAQPVAASDLAAVAAHVAKGEVAPSNEAGLVTFLAKHAGASPDDARAALASILASAQLRGDRSLVARIKTLLGGVGP